MSVTSPLQAFRASILYFSADPAVHEHATHFLDDGLLLVQSGLIVDVIDCQNLPAEQLADYAITDYRGKLLMPGFIDTHIHFPQTEMIASYGEQLLEWLERYTFPTECKFANADYAAARAGFFIDQLLRHGTTTAMVFGTVHPQSVDALFTVAAEKNMRLIAGKVLMDRHAPAELCDIPELGYRESKHLIERWHHHQRLHYAVTPRFAPTSSPAQLTLAGQLLREYPDVYLQTHLSENRAEVAWVQSLYPERKNYLDVYAHFGLTGPRSMFAHAIHLSTDEEQVLAQSHSAVAFCPSANMFLGSGLFRLHPLKQQHISVGMGTDIGAGTSFSMLQTLSDAYKIQQLQGESLSPREGLYQATLGGARALQLAERIGSFQPGREADFIVLDWAATQLQTLRQSHAKTLDERLFALMMMGDDRNIVATYVMGQCVWCVTRSLNY